jgi:thioredoxin reductase (NADPH)
MKTYDVIIIGAGPAGLGCAISAVKRNLEVLLIDKGNIAQSIIDFPINMTFFSTADLLELHDIPFNSMNFKPNRIEAVRYYQNLVRFFNIPTLTKTIVQKLERNKTDFNIHYSRAAKQSEISSKKVIIATGFYDNANLIGVDGENLDHVSHYYKDPLKHFNQDIVIVGGKNSAVIAALELHRSGANVSIIHRKSNFKESVKYWILPDIENRIAEQSISAYFDSEVSRITTEFVEFKNKNGKNKITADAVYLLTGYHPDTSLLDQIGARYHQDSLEPEIDNQTLESTIPGLYLAGSFIAGRNANKIFIENSRHHGDMILADISTKL